MLEKKIHEFLHYTSGLRSYLSNPYKEEEPTAYEYPMYLLQDTAESIVHHRSVGFSEDPLRAYIEFWGIMQAITIQQDAICELHKFVFGSKSKWSENFDFSAWRELRELRNVCAGHPARRDKKSPLTRSFMGRDPKSYDQVMFEKWEKGKGVSHPTINLGILIDAYEGEATEALTEVLRGMKERWPAH